MSAIPVHHTATTDIAWDGGANEARLSNDAGEATYRKEYAWQNPDGDPDTKAAYSFPHHEVDADGQPGAANLAACRNINARVGQSNIPMSDHEGVMAHSNAHLEDGAPAEGAVEHEPELSTLAPPRPYSHISRALYERVWAVQPQYLTFMVDMLRFRAAGGVLAAEEIEERLAEARAQNGDRGGAVQSGSVAIIPMYGLLAQRASMMDTSTSGTAIDEMKQALREALASPDIRAVVFDIDSPGGVVDGMPEFAMDLRAAREGPKPIVAQVNTLAASAAYWLASSMSEIVVTPSGEVGSIGVYAAHEDASKAYEMQGVRTTLISAGPFKTEGNSFEPLTDEARSTIQEQVDTFYQMFLSDVAKGRRSTVGAIAEGYGQGRTMLAKKALAAGMVDRIDTLEGTVRRLQPRGALARPAAEAAPIYPVAAQPAASISAMRDFNARMRAKQGRIR